jgi:hypothetical protein
VNATVHVYPGKYTEKLVVNKSLTLQSIDGWAETTIDSVPDSIIRIEGDANVTVQGFEITGQVGLELGRIDGELRRTPVTGRLSRVVGGLLGIEDASIVSRLILLVDVRLFLVRRSLEVVGKGGRRRQETLIVENLLVGTNALVELLPHLMLDRP